MKCPKCHYENREGAKFCLKCGDNFEVKCAVCGNSLPSEALFCDECGHSLIETKEASSVDYSQPHSYTPKHLVDKILTARTSIEGERKLITVLFADVTGYTSMSEKLDPEEVHQIMDGCFKILMDEIHRYEGTINQFTGDGVMALFGAPLAHEDHAQRACRAALSVQKALREYGERVARDFGIDFKMRIGLNSGPVMVGAIGDDLRMDYTAVGDTTNMASRMESLAQPGTVFLSKSTYRLVKDYFDLKPLGKMKVKGKEEPQEIFMLVRTSEVETRIGASAARGLSRFVGRKNSMNTLIDVFRKVQSGSGQIVGIVGEAGVGKSRILLEMRNPLPKNEYIYLEGRCLHFGISMAYLPILDILRSCFDIEQGDGESVIKEKVEEKLLELGDHLDGMLPPLGELLSITVDKEYLQLDPQQKRRKAFETIRDLLVRLSLDKVLVVAIEDLHWIDKTSEDFLDYLITWIGNRKILLILLYRPEYTHQWSSKSYYTHVGLDQLTMESSEELLNAIFKDDRVEPKLRNLVLERTGGNPLFIEEFTRSLQESGSIEKRNNRFVLTVELSDIRIPESVQGIIASRIDRLEENLKIVTQMASVIGREFAFGILQTITGLGEELKSYLLDLQKLEFIYEKRLYPELVYIFKHALTQEVAYETLLLKRRKVIHKKIGQAMEHIYADRLEEMYPMLAYHYDKAEIPDRAVHYLSRAADRAKAIYANEEAMIFYRSAIEQIERHRRGKEEIQEKWDETAAELHENLADVLELAGRHEEAWKEYENALVWIRKQDPIRLARLHRKAGNVRREERRYEEALQAYDQAETAMRLDPEETDPKLWQAWIEIQSDRMWLLYWQAQLQQMAELAERIRPVVEQYGTQDLRSKFLQGLSIMGQRRDRYVISEETLAYVRASLEAMQGSGNLSAIALAQFSLGFSYLWCEDLDAADEHLKATLKLAENIGDIVVQSRCLTYLTILYRKRGLVEEVKHYISRAMDVATAGNMLEYISTAKANMAWVNLREGNLSEAWKNAKAALEIWQKAPIVYPFQWTALWPLLNVALIKEEIATAVEYAGLLLEPTQQRLPDSLTTLLEKGINEWKTGESEASRSHLNIAIGLAQERGLF
jgi:class 3 adenylate cyclase